jgi:hypothetical protein
MHSAPQGMGQVGELMTQQALAHTRQSGKEHTTLSTGQPLQVGIEVWICSSNEESMGQRCSAHERKCASMWYFLTRSVIETGIAFLPLGRF